MDLGSLVTLGLRLLGVAILMHMAGSLVTALVVQSPYTTEALAIYAAYTIIGLVLVWIPGRVSNKVLRIGRADAELQFSFEQVLRVGFIFLGAYFAIDALAWFFFTYAKARWFYDVVKPFPTFRGPDLNPEDFAYLSANALQFALGLGLWLGNRPIARLGLPRFGRHL
jgi:hypothetical protein